MTERTKDWKGTTFGTSRMHRWLIASMRFLPLELMYAGAFIFVIPFCMLFAHKGYISQYRFFRRRLHQGHISSFWHTYLNHCLFATVVIDRFNMYGGGTFQFSIDHYERYQQLAKQSKGFVMLSAHVGNYELAGYKLRASDKPFNALVYAGEAPTVMENRARMLKENNIQMIPIGNDMSHLFAISSALGRGESVSIPADRLFGANRSYAINFMEAEAKFPVGPFAVAAQREVAVLAVNVMKTGVRRYHISIEELQSKAADHHQRAEELAHAFVRNLEHTVRQYPLQWYNYYDFWNED